MNTRDRMRALAPVLAGVSDGVLDDYIELAAEQMAADVWGALYQTGVAYLACHMAAQAGLTDDGSGQAQGSAAGVQTVRTQDMSVSYGQTSSTVSIAAGSDEADLMATSYGRSWLRIRAALPTSPVLI